MSTDADRDAAARARWASASEAPVDRFASSSSFAAPPPAPPIPAPAVAAGAPLTPPTVVGSTRWLRLESFSYHPPCAPPSAPPKTWDRVVRTTKKSGCADAVAILAVLRDPSSPPHEDKVVLVRQFRPPVAAYTLELPAGLIDGGESPGVAAVREFREETGYAGTVVSTSPPLCMSPGMSNESVHVCVLSVDLSLPCNQNPTTELEATEAGNGLETLLVPRGELLSRLRAAQEVGDVVFAAVYTLAMGIAMGASS